MRSSLRLFLLILLFLPVHLFACTWVSVKDFGAVGDGVTDDTKAIQKAIDSKKKLLFEDGTFLITSTLTIPSNKHIKGEQAVIRTTMKGTAIKVKGDKIKIEGLELDGASRAIHGLWIENGSNIKILNCLLHGFYGTNKEQANAIYLASGVRNVLIENCKIADVDAPLNGRIGDLFGSCQGILAMKVYNCVIRNCTFDNVKSEEDGDCIQVFSGRIGENRWDESTVSIDGCTFKNIWHRAIKLQGSNCHVSNCAITADATMKPSAAIEVFGDRCSVKNVNIELDYGAHAITVSGDDFIMDNCTLVIDKDKRHIEELKKLHADVIYCIGRNCGFRNSIITGSYIGLYSPAPKTGLRIENNEFSSSTLRGVRIYESKDAEIYIRNNTFLDAGVPIETTSGARVRIVNNRMNRSKAVINVLGRSFTGEIKGNKNGNAGNVEVNYIVQ